MAVDSEHIQMVQKGTVVEVKEHKPPVEMTPKNILDNIGALQGEVDKAKEAIAKAEESVPKLKESIVANTAMLVKFQKFEEWAEKWQRSKVRVIIEEHTAEAVKKIDADYKHDPAMTKEQNDLMKFRQYQSAMATHPSVAENISSKIMQEMFFKNPVIVNPWE